MIFGMSTRKRCTGSLASLSKLSGIFAARVRAFPTRNLGVVCATDCRTYTISWNSTGSRRRLCEGCESLPQGKEMSMPEVWHLPINQAGWHLALGLQGLFRVRPDHIIPADSIRLYPGRLDAWRWFNPDGSLRPEFRDLPVHGGCLGLL